MTQPAVVWIEAALWRWMNFARRWRWFVIAFWLIAAVVGARVTIALGDVNSDASDMIAESVPYRQAQIAFEAAFPHLDEQVLVLVRAETADATDVVASDLVRALNAKPEAVRSVFAPSVEPFFERNGLLYLDVDELEDLLARMSRSAALIERLSRDPTIEALFDALTQAASVEDFTERDAQTINDVFDAVAKVINDRLSSGGAPLSWRSIFVDDLEPPHQRLISVEPVLDFSNLNPARAVKAAVEEAGQDVQARTGLPAQIGVTGDPVLRSDELNSVSQGIGWAFLASFILVGVLLFIAFRSVVLALVTMISLLVSITVTAGFAFLMFDALNLVAVAFAVLMVGLGVDFSVHLLLHARQERAHDRDVGAALYRTSRDIGAALALTAPSTALAFLAFAPTVFVGMTQLGVVAAVGVMTAFAVATTFLPAVFSFLPPPSARFGAMVEKTIIPDQWRPRLALGVIIAGALGLIAIPFARFNADPMDLRDPNSASVQAFNLLFDNEDTTPYRLNLLVADEAEAVAAAERLEALDEVHAARILSDFVPKDQLTKLELIDFASIGLGFALSGEGAAREIEPDPAGRLIEELRARGGDSAEGLALAVERYQEAVEDTPALRSTVTYDLLRYWPHEMDRLRNQMMAREVTFDDIPEAIVNRYRSVDGRARVEVIPVSDVRDPQAREAFIEAVRAVAPDITGSARNVHEAGGLIQRAMLQATVVAFILVFMLLWFVLGDVVLIGVLLAPLALAGVLTTATSVIIGMPYNFANVIVLPLLIGIGIDSGIHLALRARRSVSARAVYESVTPRAVFFSAVTTIASFGTLSFSPHRGTASMGALLMIAIAWTLICTVMVLPLLMQRVFPKRDDV